MPNCILKVEIPESCRSDFSKFLTLRKEVASFQKVNDYFLINAFSESKEGISNLVSSINEVYNVTTLKQTPLCQGTCRNDTNCFNRAKYNGYCWKHIKKCVD